MENPCWSSYLKVLLDSMCFLESRQLKCKRGEVSRLALFCSLLVRLTMSGQAFEAWDPGGLFSVASLPPYTHSPFLSPRPTNTPGISGFPLRASGSAIRQLRSPAAMVTSLWANEQHLLLLQKGPSMPIMTTTLFELSWSQSIHISVCIQDQQEIQAKKKKEF